MRYGMILAAVAAIAVGRAEAAMHHATGSFEVTMTPRAAASDGIGRMTMTKTYTGELAGTSRGEFLSAGDPAAGSAGYVAIERIDGTLDGRAGGFVVIQSATMHKGARELHAVIAPGSGGGALTGITGRMAIRIEDGHHFYDLDYDITP